MEQQCKECNTVKQLTEYYTHKLKKNWVMWRCKECIKAWRRSDRERKLARVIDSNRTRPEWYVYEMTIKWRAKYPEKNKARRVVNNYYRYHREDKPTNCCVCNKEWRIELHHEDYNKPREVYPLCSLCHSWVHINKIVLDENDMIAF